MSSTREANADLAIIGGGPCGSATAIQLARAGFRVVLLERTRYDTPRVGEDLSPEGRPLLHELGVWDRFESMGHTPTPGVVSIWGAQNPYENDFIFNPYGHGWHLDRAQFDAMLADTAAEAGADVRCGAHVTSVARVSGDHWDVLGTDCHGPFQLSAAMIICATGRATPPGLPTLRRSRLDRLVGIVRYVTAEDADDRTLVEACEHGWWYSARSPIRSSPSTPGTHVATFMTDADMLPRGRESLRIAWRDWLDVAPFTRARLSAGLEVRAQESRFVAADTYCREQFTGPGWLLAGDAACAFDPLSSQGLHKALANGISAARVAVAGHDEEATETYAADIATSFSRYLQSWATYYMREQRWPRAPFWKRRHRTARALFAASTSQMPSHSVTLTK